MKKKTLAVLLSATLVTSSTTTVFAKDITVTIPNYASAVSYTHLSRGFVIYSESFTYPPAS